MNETKEGTGVYGMPTTDTRGMKVNIDEATCTKENPKILEYGITTVEKNVDEALKRIRDIRFKLIGEFPIRECSEQKISDNLMRTRVENVCRKFSKVRSELSNIERVL